MIALRAPKQSTPMPTRPGRLRGAARLLLLEMRHSAMLWILPVAIGLFYFTTYRKALALPPLWSLRAQAMQLGAILAFTSPVVGAAVWMGSREARRHTTDLVTITARPRWARLVVVWAASTIWAIVGYLACVAVLYGVTAHQASWGGPLWWPVAVTAAEIAAMSALGFAVGKLIPSRFTAPLVAIAAFFVLGLSTQLIHGSQSYWQVSPVVTGPWDTGPEAGAGTFYPYLPDLSIAQVMFLGGLTTAVLGALALPDGRRRWLRRPAAAITAAGILAAGTAVVLTGSGKLDSHGMIIIPALHDAANDRPIDFTPVCSRTVIPICLNPAYASYLPATAAALEPLLTKIAGLPGAPVRISQAAATYQQGTGNDVSVRLTGPVISGTPPVYHLFLPDQLLGPPKLSASQYAGMVRSFDGAAIVFNLISDGAGASAAQQAVAAALLHPAGLAWSGAAQRFAALPASAQHAWLESHLAALRAGRITLEQLP